MTTTSTNPTTNVLKKQNRASSPNPNPTPMPLPPTSILEMPLHPRSLHPLAHTFVSPSTLCVQLSPLTMVSMLDHYIRRDFNSTMVVGALLGYMNESNDEINITDAFPIPFMDLPEEGMKKDHSQLDTAYALKMYQLLRKTNQKEVVVGFYMSGTDPTDLSAQFHFIMDQLFFSPSKSIMHGVLLMFDPTLKHDSLKTRAYLGLPIGTSKKKSQGRFFVPLPVHHEKLSQNVVSLEPIFRASNPDSNSLAPLLSEPNMTQYRLDSLSDLLQHCYTFMTDFHASLSNSSTTSDQVDQFHLYCQYLAKVLATIQTDSNQGVNLETELRDFKTVVQLAEQAKKQIDISKKISFGFGFGGHRSASSPSTFASS